MFLSRVRIRDFQSIQSLDLPITSNTVLVGETDTGKSAILRAVTTLFTLPKGEAFIRDGATSCEVSVHLLSEKGETVITYVKKRKVSASISVFYPGYPENPAVTTKSWESCQELPPELQALGISELKLDNDTWVQLNLTDQLEQPFLLSNETLAAKVLGRLSFVDRVNTALRKVNADVRKDGVAKPILEKDVQDLEKKATKFSFLKDFKSQSDSLVAANVVVGELETTLKDLPLEKLQEDDLLSRIIKALNPEVLSEEVSTGARRVDSLIAEMQSLGDSKNVLHQATPLLSSVIPVHDFKDLAPLVEDLRLLTESALTMKGNKVLLSSQIPALEFQDTEPFYRAFKEMSGDWNLLESQVELASNLKDQHVVASSDLTKAESDLEALKKQLGMCPTCARAF